MTKEETKKQSEQKAFDFWLEKIQESKGDRDMYVAGCQWMVDYWQKKMTE